MENADAQIAELKQEVALLRKQLARSEAKMLACLVQANAQLLAAQTELSMFRDKTTKDLAQRNAERAALDETVRDEFNAVWKNSRLIEHKVVELQNFLWPVVENVFPNLLAKCTALGKRFKEPGLYSEPRPPRS